jgi:glycosyltransferase involved in cell wall biosynthesis
MVKVSVIVPVYNVEEYLAKCLDSLVNQTLKDIEIIVVNDGSPDNSESIAKKYVQKYKNISYYKKPNGGLSDARNYGIAKSKGDYLAFIDSDDYIDKTMLEKLYKEAISKKLDIVVCDSINVYPDKEVLVKSNLHYTEDAVLSYLLAHPMACTRLYSKKLFKDCKFKKGIYYEDLEFTPKLVNLTKKIGFVEEGLYYYVQRPGSIMKQKEFSEKLLDIFTVLDSNKKALGNNYPDEIEYMYITHLLRTATLRFLEYTSSKKYIDKIHDVIKENYPNWKNNKYYKMSSSKLKLICNLAYHKQIWLLKIIKTITGK